MTGFLGFVWKCIVWISAFVAISYGWTGINKTRHRNPLKKLAFIEQAIKDGTHTLAKISSFVVKRGVQTVEYAYKIGDEVHYITYQVKRPTADYLQKEDGEESAEVFACDVPNTTIVYYDKNNHDKAITKREVFVSEDHYAPVKMSKNKRKKNKYRNLHKHWTEPIVLD